MPDRRPGRLSRACIARARLAAPIAPAARQFRRLADQTARTRVAEPADCVSLIASARVDQVARINPFVVAYMTERLAVRPEHRVLEVGTGSGYQAAILSRLAREVVSIERYRTLADAARSRLATLGYGNVEVVAGDGLAGVPEKAPFDRILVTAAAEQIPQALVEQLGEGGVMVLPLGPHDGAQVIVTLTKTKQGLVRENLIAVRFVPLLPGKAREL